MHSIPSPSKGSDIMSNTRRQFLASSTKLLAATSLAGMGPAAATSSFAATSRPSANDKVVLGLIGARGQGMANLRQALKQPGVECGALCDVDDSVLRERSAEIKKIQGKAPVAYKDFRRLLDNRGIDAVIIGTPDHWHCYQMIAACEAGKDVYVEKPLANSIEECDLMVAAVRKYKKVVQVGQQQRSGDHWQSAMRLIKSGGLGELRKTQVWANFNYGAGQPKVPDSPVPPGVNFDMWLGPAPDRSFNKARFHGSWRMFWDYGGGLMTDWGVHLVDMALWAKDVTALPLSVAASGGNRALPDRAHETFDTLSVTYQMADHNITWEHTVGIESGRSGRNYGFAFVRNDATLVIDRSSWHLYPESSAGKFKIPALPRQPGTDSHEAHVKNWIDSLKTRNHHNYTI